MNRKRRQNPFGISPLVLVGVGGAAAFLAYQHFKAPPIPAAPDGSGTPPAGSTILPGDHSTSVIPAALQGSLRDLVLNAYYSAAAQGIQGGNQKAVWVKIMQDQVWRFQSPTWGYMYDKGAGWLALNKGKTGQDIPESLYESWMTAAITQYEG